jgi:two-component system sensor histidine kinase CreC
MSTRNRVFTGILLIYVLGVVFLLYRIIADLDPRYRESAEESLVETAQLLSSVVERDLVNGQIDATRLRPVFDTLYARNVDAQIYSLHKTRVELRVYVTDQAGRVLFDSLGRAVGEDYSLWRDVRLTLRGLYGARTTRDIPDDPRTSVLYVSAPVHAAGNIVGVVTVGKPVQSFGQFVKSARQKIIAVGVGSVMAIVLFAVIVSVWLVRPFVFLTEFFQYAKRQKTFSPARLARHARRGLAAAYQEMRDALAGRHLVSEYVQTLTHEIKSPLSAIRGAAELLQEPLPEPERQRFLCNIQRETQRIQELVDRLLELTALESRHRLEAVEPLDLRGLTREVVQATQPLAQARQVALVLADGESAQVEGTAFLLQRAIANLIENAIDFSPLGGRVDVALAIDRQHAEVRITDQGPGIPDYAKSRIFEKFFSLARPHSNKKGTGLGLAFVHEVASLHRGEVSVVNAEAGGAVATLSLPRD